MTEEKKFRGVWGVGCGGREGGRGGVRKSVGLSHTGN